MNLKHLTFAALIALLFSSCVSVYSPALYHQDIAYQPKPASFDTVKSASYVSAGFNNYLNSDQDLMQSGQFNLSRGHAFKNTNLAYGAFGVFGDLENSSIQQGKPYYFTDKFFGAVGGRASFNFFVNSGRTDFRFLGIEAAYSHEFGDYLDFRRTVNGKSGIIADTRSDLVTIGLTTEILFHNWGNTHIQHGLRGFLGTTFGNNDLEYGTDNFEPDNSKLFRQFFPKVSYFINFNKFFCTAEAGQQFFVRFGIKF